MIKHLYLVEGLDSQGYKFISNCVSTDIIKAIQMYRKRRLSVHKITRGEQVPANTRVGIVGWVDAES